MHLVISRDVIFNEEWDSMERSTNVSVAAFSIELSGDRYRIRIYFDNRMQRRIQRLDALNVTVRQFLAGQLTGGHGSLKFEDTLFNEIKTAARRGRLPQEGRDPSA